MKIPAKMRLRTLALIAVLSSFAGCGGQAAPPSYPAGAAAATAVIVDTDSANTKLSVQDGDQVIAMMQGRHYARVSIRPGTHNFSAGSGTRSQGPGTVAVDVQPGQVIYLQVGGISSRNFGMGAPKAPSYVSGVGRAEGAFGQGGVSLIPQAMAEQMIQQAAQQEPLPPS
jgi:predicted small lipoprotein YifL